METLKNSEVPDHSDLKNRMFCLRIGRPGGGREGEVMRKRGQRRLPNSVEIQRILKF